MRCGYSGYEASSQGRRTRDANPGALKKSSTGNKIVAVAEGSDWIAVRRGK